MRHVWFRFLEDGKPTGEVGFAMARTKADLFWEIDRYGNPRSVEIYDVDSMSFCLTEGPPEDPTDPEDTCPTYTDVEFTDRLPLYSPPETADWRKPRWGRLRNLL